METLTKAELKRLNEEQHEDFVLLNVLPQEEFNKQHIRTSINIPHNDENFVEMVARVAGSKQRKIVLYCASFDCPASTRAAEQLKDNGFSQLYDYEGVTKDWFEQKDQVRAA